MNFLSPEVFDLYSTRHAAGWGLDPRCTAYMTSSQALTINLFGLLRQDEAWFLKCLNAWLGRTDLTAIQTLEIEFAPARRSLHLGDQTRIDVLLVVKGGQSDEVIAVEVKYADRFNSRRVNIETPAYRELADRTRLWKSPGLALADRRTNQLARIHALATSYALSLGIDAPTSMLLISHAMDDGAARIARAYTGHVAGRHVHHASLQDACAEAVVWAPVAFLREAQLLNLRYGRPDSNYQRSA